MARLRAKFREPNFILDAVQVLVAVIAGTALALDLTGVWSSPTWFHENILSFIFIGICLLMVSSFLERQFFLERFSETTKNKLDQLINSNPQGIILEDRENFQGTFEKRLKNASDVFISGINLVGISTTYIDFIRKKVNEGCRFRILIADPTAFKANGTTDTWGNKVNLHRQDDFKQTLKLLEPLAEEHKNLEIKYWPFLPSYSLLAIDTEKEQGEIQVEIYTYQGDASARPHFILTAQKNDRWYKYFVNEFTIAWKKAHTRSGKK